MKHALALAILLLGGACFGPAGGIGLAASFSLLAFFSHSGAGWAAVWVSATAPLFYVPRPGALDPVAALAPSAVATLGLGVAALGQVACRPRWACTALGLVGLAAGAHASGALFGVVLPALGVALTWAIVGRPSDGRAAAFAGVAAAAIALGVEHSGWHHAVADTPRLGFAVGGRVHPTFDAPLAEFGRAVFPWSALMPCALLAMTGLPRGRGVCVTAVARERESALRTLLLTGTLLTYGLAAFSTRGAGGALAAGLPFIAGAIGLSLADIARGACLSPVCLLGVALLAALLGVDFVRLPETRTQTFAPAAGAATTGVTATTATTAAMTPTARTLALAAASTAGGALVAGLQNSTSVRRCVSRMAGARCRRWRPGALWKRAATGSRHRTRQLALCIGTLLGALLLRGAYPQPVESEPPAALR